MIYKKYFKRPMDFILSLIALVLLSPILLVVSILIKISSKGPIFFIQDRPGKNKDIFKVYKFRTMVENAVEDQKIGIEVSQTDSRITSIGKFLRRTKIDELPQLINVLKGDMSIVGPRPTLQEYLELYDNWEKDRFEIKPGLTGLAQINGNINLKRKEKSHYDIKYKENVKFFLDMKIIMKTFLIVILGEDKFIKNVSVTKDERKNE